MLDNFSAENAQISRAGTTGNVYAARSFGSSSLRNSSASFDMPPRQNFTIAPKIKNIMAKPTLMEFKFPRYQVAAASMFSMCYHASKLEITLSSTPTIAVAVSSTVYVPLLLSARRASIKMDDLVEDLFS